MHLGHYVGTLKNRVKLQDEYECFFIIADLHVLTTRISKEDIAELPNNVKELALDYLSVGIDPERVTIYLQSLVPEVAELALIFGMLITVPRLQRVPTLKDIMRNLHIENPSYGLLGYPVLQAADILMVRATLVPVGKDQESHVEVTRELARRFNQLYCAGGDVVFPEPAALVGDVPTLVGLDGKTKMSKSLKNCIYLSDDEQTVKKKVMSMYTDPTRIHPADPGHVEGNPVFIYHDAFNSNKEEVRDLKESYRKGQVGDVEVKEILADALNKFLDPIRQRRVGYQRNGGFVEEFIREGSKKTREEAQRTLRLVKAAMGLVGI